MVFTVSWTIDLSYGQKREKDFVELLPELKLVAQNGIKEDFIDKNGDKWELKSERRTTAQTPNIAVEVISSYKRQGAIYNAFKNKTKYICYLFADNVFFVYDVSKLYYLAKHIATKHGTIKVRNSNARIILLPRKRIQCLQIIF